MLSLNIIFSLSLHIESLHKENENNFIFLKPLP